MNQSKSENFVKNVYIHLNLSTFQVKKKEHFKFQNSLGYIQTYIQG